MLHADERSDTSDINNCYIIIRLLTSYEPHHHLTLYSSTLNWLQQLTFRPSCLPETRHPTSPATTLLLQHSVLFHYTVPLHFCSTTPFCSTTQLRSTTSFRSSASLRSSIVPCRTV